MFLSKRSFIRTTVLGFVGFLVAKGKAFAHSGHLPPPTSPPLTPFIQALTIPPVLKPKKVKGVDTYTLRIFHSTELVHPDLGRTRFIGFNTLFVGPTIIANRNTPTRIEIWNDEAPGDLQPPTVHFQGGLASADQTGKEGQTIPKGTPRTFEFANSQRGSMQWYRANTPGRSGRDVHSGLGGMYFIVDKKSEAQLKLPKGAFDIPLMIQDRAFSPGGDRLYSAANEVTRLNGHFGDTLLVNGLVQPYHEVSTTLYRFRVFNASNAQWFKLKMDNGMPIHQIGSEAGLFQRPQALETLQIGPGERVDILLDFADVPVGTKVKILNALVDLAVNPGLLRTSEIIRFDVVKKGPKKAIPETLLPWEEIVPPPPSETKEFSLTRISSGSTANWTINGIPFSAANPPMVTAPAGSIGRWRFINPTIHDHPMHLHSVHCQVIDVGGQPVDPSLWGWKDTFVVPPLSEMTVVFKYPETPGRYPFHCQVLEHQDYAMRAEFEVV